MSTETHSLMRLADTDLTLANPAEDVRGRKAVDRDGEEIGSVVALYLDESEHKVRFLEVESGGFLGMGSESRLVPVDLVRGIDREHVHVGETRERVHGSPAYDPDLTRDRDYYGSVYGWYGASPFWGTGYAYPAYPFL